MKRGLLKKTGILVLTLSMLAATGAFVPVSAGADTVGKKEVDLSEGYTVSPSAITVSVSDRSLNTVRSEIFGGNLSWVDEGQGTWNTEANEPYDVMIEKLKHTGLYHLRYPGGIEGDYFHWKDSLGPLAERKPQIDCFSKEYPTFDGYNGVEYPCEFGVDEFLRVCEAADMEATIQLNAGSGTPEEAAEYVQYLKDKGFMDKVESICVGNEVCMAAESVDTMSITKNPVDYAEFCNQVFDLVGPEVVDSDDIELGVIGITPSHPLCAYKNWDAIVLDTLAPRIDFIDVHIGYAYYSQQDESKEDCVRCFLAAPLWVKGMIEEEKSIIAEYGGEHADDIGIQISECGTVGGKYPNSLAASLFTADFYNTVLAEPKISSTDYLPVLNHYGSAQLIGSCVFSGASATETYWDNCSSHVFRWYSEQVGRDVLECTLDGAETFDSVPVGLVPEITGVPEGAVSVYYDEASGEGTVFVINKSLDSALNFDIALPFGQAEITGVTELWDEDPTACNQVADPQHVMPAYYDSFNGAFDGGLDVTSRPVSLVRIDFTSGSGMKVRYGDAQQAETQTSEAEASEPSQSAQSPDEAETSAQAGTGSDVTPIVIAGIASGAVAIGVLALIAVIRIKKNKK